MPATKLKFVKLMLELADDERFVMKLNDSQKLDYLLLLMMAGLTNNEIPLNPVWFKSRFFLEKNPEKIGENWAHIQRTFKRLRVYKGKLKFSKFKEIHNYIYKEKENNLSVLKEFYKNSSNKVNLFLIISNIITYYIDKKGFINEDIDMAERNRYGSRIKELLVKAKGNKELVERAIDWVSRQNYVDWTLETVLKKWPDFSKRQQATSAGIKRGEETKAQLEQMKKEAQENPIDPQELSKLTKQVGNI